ncbi:cytochrome P450 [Crassisporium funariophilum]|nr:cytochrome P450 [Crassisporium funariophilum]
MITRDALAATFLSLVAAYILRLIALRLQRPKYLPGPPRLPIVGNLFQMPESEAWVTYLEWKEIYGDAIYLEIFGSPIVILNTYQGCIDLLEKRSEIYSDRPIGYMVNHLMGWVKAVTMAPYNDRWRRYRRMLAQSMRKEAVKQFHPIQEREVARYLGSLIKDPEHFMENFRFTAGRSLLYNVYGIEVDEANDPIITTAEKAMEVGVFAAQPGNFLVDFFPALLRVPSWFPGAGWKEFARKGRILANDMVDIPFDKTVENMKSGDYEPSFTSINLEKKEEADLVKWCSGSMLSAGTDTSVASVRAFFLAMILNPDVQQRAQAEIDAVIGNDRLPTIADRENLPYLNAVMKELMRWQPVSPLALPHRAVKDDVYNGCFIPAGTVVMGNTWAVTRDPSLFEDPDRFIADRYLPYELDAPHKPKETPLDTSEFAFGYGRRICAGMHYAENMLFISMARIVATFDLKMAKDPQGNDVVPEAKFNSSIVREALPFKCSIQPRSEAARALVTSSLG